MARPQVRPWSGGVCHKQGMSIRQLSFLLLAGLGASLGSQAQSLPALPVSASPAKALADPGAGRPPGPSDEALGLSQVLQAARQNLEVAQATRLLAAARADVQSADHAPLPVLSGKFSSIDLQNGVGAGNLWRQKRIDKGVGLDWTWERGNKRELRTQSAQSGVAAAQAELQEVRTQQQIAAHSAFFDLLAAQERLQDIAAIAQSARQTAQAAQLRVKAGDLPAQDAERADIEAARTSTDLSSAEQALSLASLQLGQLTGLGQAGRLLRAQPEWPPTPRPEQQDGAPAVGAGPMALEAWVEARSDVVAARQRVQAAQAARDASQALKRADITWGGSVDHYPGTSTRLLELRMQMPLQWHYDYQGEIGRAQAQLDLAEDALAKTRRQAFSDMQGLQQALAQSAWRVQRYQTDIVPRARLVADKAELAYNKGALSLTDLLDARRTLRATLIDALAARTDHAQALGAWQLRTQPPHPDRPTDQP